MEFVSKLSGFLVLAIVIIGVAVGINTLALLWVWNWFGVPILALHVMNPVEGVFWGTISIIFTNRINISMISMRPWKEIMDWDVTGLNSSLPALIILLVVYVAHLFM
jgi:hypothetical protein